MTTKRVPTIMWAKFDTGTRRLTGEYQLVTNSNAYLNTNEWAPLPATISTMICSGTKKWNNYAKVGDRIVEVPTDINLNFLAHVNHQVWPEITAIDHKWTRIPWLPLDIPRIEPDNWDLFWEKWEASHAIIGRPDAPDQSYWEGLCIWANDYTDQNDFNYSQTKMEDWSADFPKMFEAIRNSMPYSFIEKIVLWKNIKEVHGHFDPDSTVYPWPDSVRVMLYDTNESPTFYMSHWPEQSNTYTPYLVDSKRGSKGFGIKPDVQPMKDRMYVHLPPETNSFIFNNGAFIHAADNANPKIIMAIKGRPDTFKWLRTLTPSFEKYKGIIPNSKKQIGGI